MSHNNLYRGSMHVYRNFKFSSIHVYDVSFYQLAKWVYASQGCGVFLIFNVCNYFIKIPMRKWFRPLHLPTHTEREHTYLSMFCIFFYKNKICDLITLNWNERSLHVYKSNLMSRHQWILYKISVIVIDVLSDNWEFKTLKHFHFGI